MRPNQLLLLGEVASAPGLKDIFPEKAYTSILLAFGFGGSSLKH